MQVICISRGTLSGGKELALLLAKKLGYSCVSREELMEAATKEGIQVGKLELAMVKPGAFTERLALEKDHYLAFTTALLCDKSMEGGLVYHGRTGHFLLPGVSHVLKARVLADAEYRIKAVMRDLGLDRAKARRYIEEVDEDRRRWVRSMYGVSWEEATNYDVVLNLAQVSLENAATILMHMAELPDFQTTPASKESMQDLRLAAKARVVLARDERTCRAAVKVRADNGVVNVTYLPQDSSLAAAIPTVCQGLAEVKEVRATMAMTNLLWIQEEFQPNTGLYDEVVDLATRWNAAVELVRCVPESTDPLAIAQSSSPAEPSANAYDGGIEEDVPDESDGNGGLKRTLDELAKVGRSGGGRVVHGDPQKLVGTLDRTIPYTLVVLGEMFLSKGHAARLRATRDLQGFLGEHINAPVVSADELRTQYMLGKKDILRTAVFLLVSVLLYLVVFSYEVPIMEFLGNSGWYADAMAKTFLSKFEWAPKLVIAFAVFMFAPVVAYFYGTVANTALKLIRIE